MPAPFLFGVRRIARGGHRFAQTIRGFTLPSVSVMVPCPDAGSHVRRRSAYHCWPRATKSAGCDRGRRLAARGRRKKIDRRAYRVKTEPSAAQFNGIRAAGMPAVTITPDDQIMPRGAGVTILVDERPVQGDPIRTSARCTAAKSKRIGLTNPSAAICVGDGGSSISCSQEAGGRDLRIGQRRVASRGRVESGTTIKKKKGSGPTRCRRRVRPAVLEFTYRKLRAIRSWRADHRPSPRGRWRTFVAEPHVFDGKIPTT